MSYNHARGRIGRATTPALAALALGLTLTLSACGSATSADATAASSTPADVGIAVGDPWVRATEGTEDTSMTAAFMTLDNPSDQDVTLEGAESSVAGMVQLHEMTTVDGAMVMQEVPDGIPITAGRGKVLQPGGLHVMLMGLTESLAPGDEVDLTLRFSDGSTEELTVPVKEFTEEEGHYHSPGTAEHDHADGEDGMTMEETDGMEMPSETPAS